MMEESAVPGVSIVLIRDARLFWRRGFGVKDSVSKTPIDPDTVFEAASMSKPPFAYVVMKLCERGVLDLDTPLSKYVSERYLDGDPRLDLITARHVLSHTSGFQNWRSGTEPLKIHFTPGERYLYSGEGYSYLQAVVTQSTGRIDSNDCATFEDAMKVCATDFDQYMKANLFVPFGMAASRYLWDADLERHAARPHDSTGRPIAKPQPSRPAVSRYAAAGGLLTTPTDYAKFLIEVMAPKPSDAWRLSAESVKEMLRPHIRVPDVPFAMSWSLGWRISHGDRADIINHDGGQAGFRTFGGFSVERRSGFVVMTNGDNGEAVIEKLLDMILPVLEP